MLAAYKPQGCKINWKVHFPHTLIDNFFENFGAYSEEHGKIFRQNDRDIERRYQERWRSEYSS